MNEMIHEMNHILNCGNEIKEIYDPRSYGRNLRTYAPKMFPLTVLF